jgi:hypothetical protein
MNIFLESPWPALMLSAVIEAVLAITLIRTGRVGVGVAMAVVLVVAGVLVLVERLVVTEREEIENALAAVATSLESNDARAVLSAFEPGFAGRNEIERALARFTVREAHIGGDLEVRLNPLTTPPSASAYFTGRVEGKDSRGEFPYEHLIRRFKVVFHRHDGRWLIADYTDQDLAGPQKRGKRGN